MLFQNSYQNDKQKTASVLRQFFYVHEQDTHFNLKINHVPTHLEYYKFRLTRYLDSGYNKALIQNYNT